MGRAGASETPQEAAQRELAESLLNAHGCFFSPQVTPRAAYLAYVRRRAEIQHACQTSGLQEDRDNLVRLNTKLRLASNATLQATLADRRLEELTGGESGSTPERAPNLAEARAENERRWDEAASCLRNFLEAVGQYHPEGAPEVVPAPVQLAVSLASTSSASVGRGTLPLKMHRGIAAYKTEEAVGKIRRRRDARWNQLNPPSFVMGWGWGGRRSVDTISQTAQRGIYDIGTAFRVAKVALVIHAAELSDWAGKKFTSLARSLASRAERIVEEAGRPVPKRDQKASCGHQGSSLAAAPA